MGQTTRTQDPRKGRSLKAIDKRWPSMGEKPGECDDIGVRGCVFGAGLDSHHVIFVRIN